MPRVEFKPMEPSNTLIPPMRPFDILITIIVENMNENLECDLGKGSKLGISN